MGGVRGMQISPEGKIGIGLTLGFALGAGWVMVAPDQAKFVGWVTIGLSLGGLLWLLHHHLSGKLGLSWKEEKRKMIAFSGMIVSGAALCGFAGVYFWPKSIDSSPPETPTSTTPDRPDVALRFVDEKRPMVVLFNQSNIVAKTIKWSVALWNMDDPRVYLGERGENLHGPLPIPVQTFDFLRPGAAGGPQVLFDTSLVSPHVKDGQELFGSAFVICPECSRGHTYIVDIVLGVGGWWAEVPANSNGELIVPKMSTKDGVVIYKREVLGTIPDSAHIQIRDP
jgi:hypothetical protein